MTPVLELHQLLINKCSHSMAIPTFNECIWTYRNRSWYKPAARPATERPGDGQRNLRHFTLVSFLLLQLFGSTDISLSVSKVCHAGKEISLDWRFGACADEPLPYRQQQIQATAARKLPFPAATNVSCWYQRELNPVSLAASPLL